MDKNVGSKMMDNEGYKNYTRQKISIENKLSEFGDLRGSSEIESQVMFAEERLIARIKQAYSHAAQELNALRMVLIESNLKRELNQAIIGLQSQDQISKPEN